jgi:hypothetical protein
MATPGSPPRSPLKYSSLPCDDSEDEEEEEEEDDDEQQQGRRRRPPPPPPTSSSGSGGGSDGKQQHAQQQQFSSSPPASPTRTPRSGRMRRAALAAALDEQDSPYFRDRVRASIAETKACSGWMKELMKGMKELGKATATLAGASRALAKANGKAAARLPAEEGGVQPLLQRFGATLQEMAVAQETLAHALCESFVAPLEAFCAEEVDRLVELERAYEREKGDFTEALGKLLRTQIKPTATGAGGGGSSSSSSSSTSSAAASAFASVSVAAPKGMGGGGPGAGGVLVQRAREVGRSRREFEQARLRLAGRVEEAEARRTLEVTEGVAAVLLHLESHHRLCLDVLAGLGPSLERLREGQVRARDGVEAGRGQWERKGEMLEMLLPADLAGEWGGWTGGVMYECMCVGVCAAWALRSLTDGLTSQPPPTPTTDTRAPAGTLGGSTPRPHSRRRGAGPRRNGHRSIHPPRQEAGRPRRRPNLPAGALPRAAAPRGALRILPVAPFTHQGPGWGLSLAPALVRPGGVPPLFRAGVGQRPRRGLGGAAAPALCVGGGGRGWGDWAAADVDLRCFAL